MSDDEWAKNLWSIANAITAFAVAQGLAFGYVLGRGEIHKRIQSLGSRIVIVVASVGAMAFYCAVMYRLGHFGRALDLEHSAIWRESTIARIIAIIFFTLLPLVGLIDRRTH